MQLKKTLALALGFSVIGIASFAPAKSHYKAEVVTGDPDERPGVCASSEVGKTFRRQEAIVREKCSTGQEICQRIRIYRDWKVAAKSRDGRACMWKQGKRQFSVLDCEKKTEAFQGRTCLSVGQEYLIKNR